MNDAERQEQRQNLRKRLEPYIRAQVAACERILSSEQHMTRPEKLEEIRRGIKASARAYLSVMTDPVGDEQFTLSMEVFDEIVDAVVRTAVH